MWRSEVEHQFWRRIHAAGLATCGCEELALREASRPLVGLCLLEPDGQDPHDWQLRRVSVQQNDAISIRLASLINPSPTGDGILKSVVLFMGSNQLTVESALGLVHLFHHLRDCAFEAVNYSHLNSGSHYVHRYPLHIDAHPTMEQLFNAVERLAGAPLRIRCRSLSASFVPSAEEVGRVGRLFDFRTLVGVELPTEMGQLCALLDEMAATHANQTRITCLEFNIHPIRLHDVTQLTAGAVDRVVDYFQQARDLSCYPPHIIFPTDVHGGGSWPSLLEDGGLAGETEECWVQEFRVTNQMTGQPFRVQVWMRKPEAKLYEDTVHFLLGEEAGKGKLDGWCPSVVPERYPDAREKDVRGWRYDY